MSSSRSSRSPKSARVVRNMKKRKKASPAVAAARAPWIFNGVDYGPARTAVRDLATWAFDLAESHVDDWPAARSHIRKTRQLIEARILGKRSKHEGAVTVDDIVFTAELIARILDEDLGLSVSEALTILDKLELPLDAVAVHRPAPRARDLSALAPVLASITPLIMPTLQTLAKTATHSAPATPVAPLRLCDGCGYVHEQGDHVRHRNAA